MDIKNDPHVIEYLQNQNIRKSTEETYMKRIKTYCEYTDKTPPQLRRS